MPEITDINVFVCKALGLVPTDVRAITIHFEATRLPTVNVEYARGYLADHPDLLDVLYGFQLVPAAEPVDA